MPLDNAQWQIDILASDMTAKAFASVTRSIQQLSAEQAKLNSSLGGSGGAAGQLKEMGDNVSSIVATGKSLIALALGQELIGWAKDAQQAVAALSDQAKALSINTDQLQAYQTLARSSGVGVDQLTGILAHFNAELGKAAQGDKDAADTFRSLGVRILDANGNVRPFADNLTDTARALVNSGSSAKSAADQMTLFGRAGAVLAPFLQGAAQGMTQLDAASKAAGQTVGGETIETFRRLEEQSEQNRIKIRNFYAEIAAPIEAAGLSWFARRLQEISYSLALINTHSGAFQQIKEIMNILSGGLAGSMWGQDAVLRATQSIDGLRTKAVEAEIELQRMQSAQKNAGGVGIFNFSGISDADIAKQQKNLAQAKANLASAEAVMAAFESSRVKAKQQSGPSIDSEIGDWSKYGANKFANSKASGRDRIGEEMIRLKGEIDAANASYEVLNRLAGSGIPLNEITLQADAVKRMGDELAKIGKYNENDPRIKALQALVLKWGEADLQAKQFSEALKTADATERQYGDGSLVLTEQLKALAAAWQTGLMSPQAYDLAITELTRNVEDLRLKNIGLQGGLPALAAGFEAAARQYGQQNTLFATGGQIFTQSMNLMDQAVSEFVQNGTINFTKLAQSFATMLLQMELRAAASFLFNQISGLFSSGGNLGMAEGTMGGGNSVTGMNGGMPIFGLQGRASGGDVSGGGTYLVGENGPEVVTFPADGHVFNRSQLGGMGGGASVTVNVINNSDSKVSTRQSTGPGGMPRIDILIDAMDAGLASNIARGKGPMAKVLAAGYGPGAPRN